MVLDALPRPADPLHGAFDREREIGMIILEPSTRRRMRVNGTVRAVGGQLLVRTTQVFANCPKYLQSRHVIAEQHEPGGLAGAASIGAASIGPALTAPQRRWIATADTFFVATRAAGLGSDVSHRGGNPGFVTVAGPDRLAWPDYVGNSMYLTLGNLAVDPSCGLLFVDWERGHTLALSGRASVDWDPDRAAATPGAQRMVDFEVERVVQVEESTPLRWAFDSYHRFNPPVAADPLDRAGAR